MPAQTVDEKVRQEGSSEQAPVCQHHWVIESPHGATSHGVCKRCGEEREFQNSASDTLWEGDPMRSASRMAGGGGRSVVKEREPATSDD